MSKEVNTEIHNLNAAGYFVTSEIKQALEQSPRLRFNDDLLGQLSVVFGCGEKDGDPSFSAFCRIERPDGAVSIRASGGREYGVALEGLGFYISRRIRQELDREAKERNRS